MPKESKESKAIMKKVKEVTTTTNSLEEGLKSWEESFKSAIASGTPEQAVVDHWKALEYLHKLQSKVVSLEEAEKRGDAVDETLKTMKASATILTRTPSRLMTPVPVLKKGGKHRKSTPAPAASSSSASSGTSPDMGSPLTKLPSPGSSPSPSPSGSLLLSPTSSTKSPSGGSARAPSPSRARRNPIQKLSDLVFSKGDPYDKIKEANGEPVKHLKPGAKFTNFGGNVNMKPSITFEPETRTGVCNIVKWAVAHGKRVRASGYRHTWSGIYGEEDEVLLSMIPAKIATGKSFSPIPRPVPHDDDLEGITFLREENGEAIVRIGASTSNDQFRVWALQNGWTFDMSVDLVEITFGGQTSPMTHGTGLQHPTMSDLVVEVEFVNVNGELQTVNSESKLRAAAGALGVMGIITAVTMRLQRMTYAAMKPYKTPAMLGIPPPLTKEGQPAIPIPSQLNGGFSAAQLKGAQETFELQVANEYYNEYFWFPFQEKAFVNCWQNDGDPAKSKTLSNCEALMQDVQGALGSVANAVLGAFQGDGEFMTKFVAWSAMKVLPDLSDAKEPEVTPVIEAFYFRRGLHNMPMLDMELIIPIPGRADKPEKPDWTIINRAWWDCINLIYEYAAQDKYPVRLGLAMHIISDSNMIMAPEAGNKRQDSKLHKTFGSLSINISTVPQTPQAVWFEFCQALADKWQSYTYPTDPATRLNVRAHWVKEWEMMTYDGVPLAEHYRKVAYKDAIPEFLTQLKAIATAGKFDYKQMRKTFGNPLLDSILWPPKN